MHILNTFVRISLLFLVATIMGCDDRKIFTTLAIDKSGSNINNKDNREKIVEICKIVVSKMKDTDILTVKKFDYKPQPSKMDQVLAYPNAKNRNQFKQKDCSQILPYRAAINGLHGTDIHGTWMEFYQNYKQNIKSNSVEVLIFIVDALEAVEYPKQVKISSLNVSSADIFKTSIQKFIKDGNFIVILISNEKDRELLAEQLNSITDQQRHLIMLDPNDNYKQRIEEVYKKAREKFNK